MTSYSKIGEVPKPENYHCLYTNKAYLPLFHANPGGCPSANPMWFTTAAELLKNFQVHLENKDGWKKSPTSTTSENHLSRSRSQVQVFLELKGLLVI